jgi:3-deoxy-D-manno-octulosonic-acid transferase
VAALRLQLAGRTIWLMASTHRGEEEMAIAAHRAAWAKHPGLLTIIVPRHAARSAEVAHILTQAGLGFARRSRGEAIEADTQIYLADTMGELGLFYRLCGVTVLGGSFVRIGGHNPIEPAQLDTAIVFGPYMYNFSEIAREFVRAGAALQLQHANEIAFAIDRLLAMPMERIKCTQSARVLADQKRHILDQIIVELEPWLSAKQQALPGKGMPAIAAKAPRRTKAK